MKIDMYGNLIHEPWNPSYGSGSSSSGGSLDLYECSYVDDGLPIPAIPAGITIKGDSSVAGVYKADNASATYLDKRPVVSNFVSFSIDIIFDAACQRL